MSQRKTIQAGDRVRDVWRRGALGTAIRRGRDHLGIYVEVRYDAGDVQRVHPSQLERVPEPAPTV